MFLGEQPFCKRAIGLDIGSNTFSCAELSLNANGSFAVTKDTSLPVRLSEGLKPGGPLNKAAIMRGLYALEKLSDKFLMNKLPVRAVATSPLRLASNSNAFIEPANEITGVQIEILSGKDEAVLGSRGAVLNLPRSKKWTVMDVGGRSTEICVKSANGIWNPQSIPVGMLEITNRFLSTDPPSPKQIDQMQKFIEESICKTVENTVEGCFVGVAGTASTLGLLETGSTRWQREQVHGHKISIDKVEQWLKKTISISVEDRKKTYGLGKVRADVFPAGLCIYFSMMKHFNIPHMTISANGLRVGAAMSVLKMLQK